MQESTSPRSRYWLFMALHFLGVIVCLFTLGYFWLQMTLVRVVLQNTPILHLIDGRIPTLILFGLIVTTTVVGLGRIIRLRRMRRRGEPIEDSRVQLRIGLYVVVGCLSFCVFVLSTAETFSGPFRVRFPVMAWISASLAYGMWCVLPRLRFRFSSRTRHWLDVIGMNLVLTIVFAEVVLRIAAAVLPTNPILMTHSATSNIQRTADRMQPGAMRFSFPINSQGYYDTEFLPVDERSLPLVVNIGDSFSYGVVPHHYHYTTVAERESGGAEIYNIGFPGTDPVDYLHHLVEEALPLNPDVIVIALFVGNDIETKVRSVPPNHWFDAQRYMVGIVWHRLQIVRRAGGSDWTQDTPNVSGKDLVDQYPWLVDPLKEKPSLGEDLFLAIESRNAYLGATDDPGVYDQFFEVLQCIEDAAGDVPLAFLIIPDEYQIDDELWRAVVEKNERPMERDLPQRKIRQWAEAGDRDIVDLLPLFRTAEPLADGKLHLFHLRDMHLNARGNEIAGRALAEMIESKLDAADSEVPVPELPLQVEFGKPESRTWMHSGWSRDEPGRVWSNASQSTLKIPLPSEHDLRMQIQCLPFQFSGAPDQKVEIRVNNQSITTLDIKPGQTGYSVVLPSATLRDRVDRIEFRYGYTRSPKDVLPNSVDARTLAVAWLSIEFSEITSDQPATNSN